MFVAITKLSEVIARALVVVGVTYTLPLEEAGQFGIVVTLIGVFSFLIGWERHVDIQRRFVGESDEELHCAISRALQLYFVNSLFMVPVLLFTIWWWAGLSGYVLGLAAIIVFAEQIGNQIYHFALISNRFHKLLAMTATRNVVLMFAVAIPFLINHKLPGLSYVMECWAIVSIIAITFTGLAWVRIERHSAIPKSIRLGENIWGQHKASAAHFLLGLVAILTLQFDRLMVGGMLELREVGVYFRHLLLVSLVYQFFNITSYGRLVPLVFKMAKSGNNVGLDSLIIREWIKNTTLVFLILFFIYSFNSISKGYLFIKYNLDWSIIIILLASANIRIFADFNGMILNSMNLENILLKIQIISFIICSIIGFILIIKYNIYGASYAMLISSLLYFTFSFCVIKKERRKIS